MNYIVWPTSSSFPVIYLCKLDKGLDKSLVEWSTYNSLYSCNLQHKPKVWSKKPNTAWRGNLTHLSISAYMIYCIQASL